MFRTIRFRRALTTAALVATATGAIALTAEPAFAIGPATVTKSGTVLTLTATPGTQDAIRIHEDPTTFSLRDLSGLRAAAGSGCVGTGTGTSDLVCSKAGISPAQHPAQHRTRGRGQRRPGQHQLPVPGHSRRRHRQRPLRPRHGPRRPRRLRDHPLSGAHLGGPGSSLRRSSDTR